MTKADIVTQICEKTGMERVEVQVMVEAFMESVKESMLDGNNVYLRGFGSFIVKKRAAKKARNISKNEPVHVPAHNIPAFKPARTFLVGVRDGVPAE